MTEQVRPDTEVAKELGIFIDTLRSWLKSSAGVSKGQAESEILAATGALVRDVCAAQTGSSER